MTLGEPLACPRCAATFPLDRRFCPTCGMPLVYAGAKLADAPITEQHVRARKIKPQYTEGDLVRVAGAANQAEAEFIQGMLLEEGVPSLLKRSAGFDVPDFMAAGPRDILVPASGAQAAREVLLEAEIVRPTDDADVAAGRTKPVRILAALLLGVAIGAVILFMATHVWP